MILARSARRAFILEGELPDPSLRFLQALPDMPNLPDLDDRTIRVHRRPDGLLETHCSWGRRFTGSDRALTRILVEDFLRLALADAGSAPILASTVLRLGEKRLALIGADDAMTTRLAIALIEQGAAFEGAGFSVIDSDGLLPHPRKPRLCHGEIGPRREDCGLSQDAVDLSIAHDVTCSMVDPTFGGRPWRVLRGKVQQFVFVDGNDQGRASLAPIAFAEALARTMRRIHVPKTTGRGLASIHAALAGASHARLTLGGIAEGAALVSNALDWTQRPRS